MFEGSILNKSKPNGTYADDRLFVSRTTEGKIVQLLRVDKFIKVTTDAVKELLTKGKRIGLYTN